MLNFDTFLFGQPRYPDEMPTDRFYFNLAKRLIEEAGKTDAVRRWHSSVIDRAALCLVGYYQDMIADAGLWHGFIDECRRLYSTPVPFFTVGEDYVDYELNREDVGFLVWYAIAMYSDDRCIYPFDAGIVELADRWFGILEENYDEAPVPEGFHLAHELDVYDPEDQEMLLRLGNWLYLHSWLLMPAFAYTSSELISNLHAEGKSDVQIAEALQGVVGSHPTGPLALFIGEWVHLTVRHRLPSSTQKAENKEAHPSFKKLMDDTGGVPVKFISGYDHFNNYLIEVLGWQPGVSHLQQLSQCRDFVVMSNPDKGLLVATDICRCIKAPSNPYYDEDYARDNAIRLLTERGICPHDLLSFICEQGWLVDARFPHSDDTVITRKYHDFIARCYLQLYYRGD